MAKQLFLHINRFIKINEKDFREMLSFFELHTFDKKDIIMNPGNRCNNNFFVLEGCVHMYFTNDNGIDRTVQFAIENWWITDNLAYYKKSITNFGIQAVEPTQILSLSHSKQEQLLAKFPSLEKYFRIVYQISYGSSIMKTKYLYEFSKEDIYFHFTSHYPWFAQRVPQYLIASFLGLTPEYVSEIKNKKRS
ncbi:Crp/Fnr family transcriptional regulator [Abyssalbus ytuae]|uniref:Crp/Fnr family transcriptional regulator n=1 Tax=Abyssalbus ytuae TaxID=2926907 RepID=A0A9E7A326_9FLAO|nr:Crp/Fnr family transcriptional regulator [Abyssalbus ytuae]UOB18951.1 Crp/Fnr family transcriptional regulator [Abyssalbus ytuae]